MNSAESASSNYWLLINKYENALKRELENAFAACSWSNDCSFASFHFRSFTLPGSRRDIISIPHENDAGGALTQQLLNNYVLACGPSRTLNSLMINRTQFDAITIVLARDFGMTVKNKTLTLNLPGTFLFADLTADSIRSRWSAATEETTINNGEAIWPYSRLDRLAVDALLHLRAVNQGVFEGLWKHLGESMPGRAGLERLVQWTAAIIGIAPFIARFGQSFAARRVPYPEANRLKTGASIPDPMPSAMTWIAQSQKKSPEAALFQLVTNVTSKCAASWELEATHFAKAVDASRKRMTQDLHIPHEGLPLDRLPDLSRVLDVARHLVGEKEEKRPLSFVFLCGLETEVLRQHVEVGDGGDWRLQTVMEIDSVGSGGEERAAREMSADGVAREIKKNAGLLQVPGRALFFGPTDWYPDAIVALTPFEPSRELDMLKEYTISGGVALSIRDLVNVFAKGQLVVTGRGRPLRWQQTDGVSLSEDTLAAEITKHFAMMQQKQPDDVVSQRIATVAKIAVRVREQGHGCLLFLRLTNAPTPKPPQRRPMARLWTYHSDLPSQIEAVRDHDLLAALAGMDGETAIDLATGSYFARLEHVVPPSKMISTHLLGEDNKLETNPDLTKLLTPRRDWAEEVSEAELEKLGTRHMKALRITYAYRKVLAVTVSSDGDVRLWREGRIAKQWKSTEQ